MTIDEAITRIRIHKRVHNMDEEPRAIYISEALDMAIKALEEQQNPNSIRINFVGKKEAKEFNEYLKNQQESVLDKIRAEIEGKYRVILKSTPKDDWTIRWNDCLDEVLEIIDKYMEMEE